MKQDLIDRLSVLLLKGRTWRYLRYLHFRDYLRKIADEIESVCVCGAGHGFAELALAAEFPNLKFTLTDIVNRAGGYPNYHNAMAWAWREQVDNIAFSIWNVLQPTERRFDLVASTEMLEHIKKDALAARNMYEASDRYLYCVVPFATPEMNANPSARSAALKRLQHEVVGYDIETLTRFFPNPQRIAGVYWEGRGRVLREKLHQMSDEEIEAQVTALKDLAQTDLVDEPPGNPSVVQGIKILSRVA